MDINDLVARLKKSRKTGASRWIACCPAHEDKTPSLAISQVDDGRILIKCFAECAPQSILAAIGLSFSDLFPERLPKDIYKPIRKPFPAADVLELLRTEAMIVWIDACRMAGGETLSPAEKVRLDTAARRIEVAING